MNNLKCKFKDPRTTNKSANSRINIISVITIPGQNAFCQSDLQAATDRSVSSDFDEPRETEEVGEHSYTSIFF